MKGLWKFKEMDKSTKLVDPIQNQFFSPSIVGGLTSALVRETIQNSLDAKTKVKYASGLPDPVKVRFVLSGKRKAINPGKANNYFFGIRPHLCVDNNGLQQSRIPDFTKPVPYLLIEDFNTIGLEGDPLEYSDPVEGDRDNHCFFWFWRNVGRSDKGHDARGRWGLGKAVFPKSSDINTFFGLTIRESDNRILLMGESILRIHRIPGEEKKRHPYGTYGNYNDPEDKDFVSPIEDKEIVENFISDFGLNRKDNNGQIFHGLSIVIPCPAQEISLSEIIKNTVIQYFYPIILEQLIVTVEDENINEPIIIDSDNIGKIVNEIVFASDENINGSQLRKLFDFTRWIINLGDYDFIELLEPQIEYDPVWYQEWYLDQGLKELLAKKIERFDHGERIAFKVPVKVQVVGKPAKMAFFKVFMEKDEDLSDSDCHFIRDGITIVGIKPLRRKDVRALVIIDDPLLSRLLGDAENPAHTEWSKDSPNLIGKYVNGDKVISFVINSLDRLNNWLMKPAEGIDFNILDDIFYIETLEDSETGLSDDTIEEDGDTTGDSKPSLKKRDLPIVVRKIDNGVLIKANPRASTVPKTIRLRLAYMISGGNPLTRYNSLDFDLGNQPIKIESSDITILNQKGNFLEFEINSSEFKVNITGFDSERDLFVKAEYND